MESIANKAGGVDKTALPAQVSKLEEKTYPYTTKKSIWIKRKDTVGVLPTVNVEYEPEMDTVKRIGASFKKGTGKPLGLFVLTDDEVAVCMPHLLGVKPSHHSWDEVQEKYWNNLSVPIPYEGRKLNLNVKHYKDTNGEVKWKPENTFEYVLYKYCLMYSSVANDKNDVRKSPNIEFYLEDQDVQRKLKIQEIKVKDEAMMLRLDLQKDIETVRNVLYMFNVLPYPDDEGISDKLAFTEIAEKEPKKFMDIAGDKQLMAKAFVKRCIAHGFLTQPPGSNMIANGGEILGNNLDETVVYLADPEHQALKLTLTAKLENKFK